MVESPPEVSVSEFLLLYIPKECHIVVRLLASCENLDVFLRISQNIVLKLLKLALIKRQQTKLFSGLRISQVFFRHLDRRKTYTPDSF